MPGVTQDLSFLDLGTLNQMRTAAVNAYLAACNSQNYSVGNRHQQNIDIAAASQELANISVAIQKAGGTVYNVGKVGFTTPYEGGNPQDALNGFNDDRRTTSYDG